VSDTEPLPRQQRPDGHAPYGPGSGQAHPPNGQRPGPYSPAPEQRRGYEPYDPGPGAGYAPYGPGEGRPASRSDRRSPRPRDGSGTRRTALVVQAAADVAAGFLGLWVVLYLLDANQASPFVDFVKGIAEWLGWWAQDIFTMDLEGLRVILNYGLPAVIYLLVGHGFATWLRRL
jgi:hypothetical protein